MGVRQTSWAELPFRHGPARFVRDGDRLLVFGSRRRRGCPGSRLLRGGPATRERRTSSVTASTWRCPTRSFTRCTSTAHTSWCTRAASAATRCRFTMPRRSPSAFASSATPRSALDGGAVRRRHPRRHRRPPGADDRERRRAVACVLRVSVPTTARAAARVLRATWEESPLGIVRRLERVPRRARRSCWRMRRQARRVALDRADVNDATVLATGLVLVAALMHATWNALVKGDTDRTVALAAVLFVGALLGVVVVVVRPLPSNDSWPWLIGSALTHGAYYTCLLGAYRTGDLGHVTQSRAARPDPRRRGHRVGAACLDERVGARGRGARVGRHREPRVARGQRRAPRRRAVGARRRA